MSTTYALVKWNANKRAYDRVLAGGVLAYVGLFVAVGRSAWTGAEAISLEVLLLRALATCAFAMLHVVLCLGPLARLDPRLLPLVYNRRHLGVATFLVAAAHGTLAVGYYHGFGAVNPLVSLLASNTNYASWRAFPFEALGLGALAVLWLLAVSSHDFWQKQLGPSVWKSLHMLVYPAYALVVLHVALGALQTEGSLLYPALVGLGVTVVVGLHVTTGLRETRRDRAAATPRTATKPPSAHVPPAARPPHAADTIDWLDVGPAQGIPDGRARVVCLPGRERVAIFRHGLRLSAVTNVCAHQRGPLGEGRIVDGCITCPWHGWEYRPEDGRSPPPFQERIATYSLRVVGGRIELNPVPWPPGTPVELALLPDPAED